MRKGEAFDIPLVDFTRATSAISVLSRYTAKKFRSITHNQDNYATIIRTK